MMKKIFWKGLKVFLPLGITFATVIWVFISIEKFFGYFLQFIIPKSFYFYGLGILVGISLIFAIGLLVNAWLIRYLYVGLEKLVKSIPLMNTVYSALQDLMHYFDKSKDSTQNQAVLIETPLGKVFGFITRDEINDLPFAQSQQEVLVYVPLSYQIGGMLLVVARHQVTLIEWPANQLMSFILTAGMTAQK